MGKIIKPDTDLWKSPVRRAAIEDRVKERTSSRKCDDNRKWLTAVIILILVSPVLFFVFKKIFKI